MVIRLPESGKKALYVNPELTTHFEGWTVEESRGLSPAFVVGAPLRPIPLLNDPLADPVGRDLVALLFDRAIKYEPRAKVYTSSPTTIREPVLPASTRSQAY